jgi:catechol 2,3-dioxygenase-like lactoylglutathione lyase family enzyme
VISIKGLYEAHLTVSNRDQSVDFYRNVIGLELAHTIPERNVAFLWIGGECDRPMLVSGRSRDLRYE